jgi:hypothetical protein
VVKNGHHRRCADFGHHLLFIKTCHISIIVVLVR